MTQPPWVLAPPPDHPYPKNISAHGHSEHLISSYVCFISSAHLHTTVKNLSVFSTTSPKLLGAALGPPLEATSCPG